MATKGAQRAGLMIKELSEDENLHTMTADDIAAIISRETGLDALVEAGKINISTVDSARLMLLSLSVNHLQLEPVCAVIDLLERSIKDMQAALAVAEGKE